MAATPGLTLGESLAHIPRSKRWVKAVSAPILVGGGMTLLLIYGCIQLHSPSFFSSVPWRLPPVLSYGPYWSVLFLTESYAELFLPNAPAILVEKLRNVGGWGVGLGVLGIMLAIVVATAVQDTLVLAGCTCASAVCIAGLVAFWVRLAGTYGALDSSSTVPAASQFASHGKQPPRPLI